VLWANEGGDAIVQRLRARRSGTAGLRCSKTWLYDFHEIRRSSVFAALPGIATPLSG
jgi:hypothetical protein